MANRKQIEDRILQILAYIDQEKTILPLAKNLKLFSLEELLQLLNFLETWNYKPIYQLVDKKIKEYLEIMEEIKQIQIWKKMKNFKQKELEEQKQENLLLENMLAFN